MRPHLRAGIAVYNEGRRHAAHDAWEERWLDLTEGEDERLLHGLIQLSAVVYHADEGNRSGAQGLAESAGEYLADLPDDYRGVNLGDVRPFLAEVAADPEHAERTAPPALTYEGVALGYDDLGFQSTAVAAEVLAEADGYDEDAVEQAVTYAREDLANRGVDTMADDVGGAVQRGTVGDDTFVSLVFAFVRDAEQRPLVAERLGQHVQRRESRESDVEGLFE
ncbi:DUF309 domain-containing protein [Halomicrobium salinisoli]|uniref:DUF309 domain-containing protein n=1 Tax=Halomicrobium salinisoli TaxID=2878391 RepID=UPI001CF00550|nr:DUF309 domain-containing protein [Halomicrobium salinisoli]